MTAPAGLIASPRSSRFVFGPHVQSHLFLFLFTSPIVRETKSSLPCLLRALPSRLSLSLLALRYLNLGKGKKTKVTTYNKRGGTGKNEAFHRNLNLIVTSVSRLGPDVCDQRVLQIVHRYNFQRDKKLGRTSKQSTLWVWRKRIVNDAAKECLVAEPFPKAGPRPDVRPYGVDTQGLVLGPLRLNLAEL